MISLIQQKLMSGVKRLYFSSVTFGLPRLSAILLFFLIKQVNEKGSKHILCFGSLAALDDIKSLVEYSGKYKYSYFDRRLLGCIVRKYLPDKDLTEGSYHIDEKFRSGRDDIYSYIQKMFPILKVLVRFDAMMSSNIGYVEQQEFVKIGRESSIPIVVLYKEGLINPKLIDNVIKNYEYDSRKSQCDLFLCYASYIRDAMLRNKVEGLTKDNTKATGIPRLDYYSHNLKKTNKNKIVLFSFYSALKYGDTGVDEQTLRLLEKETESFHKLLIRYAVNNPEKEVIIKTKPPYRHVQYIKKLVDEELSGEEFPRNLLITNKGDAMQLVAEAGCVLCSNSTTLLEALLARKPIGCPDFGAYFDFPEWNIFEGYDYLVNYVTSYDELDAFIGEKQELTNSEIALADEMLKRYIYCTDGMASQNVENHISELF